MKKKEKDARLTARASCGRLRAASDIESEELTA